MDTIADYNSWKARQQQSGVGAAQIVLDTVTVTPDEAAGDLNLASEFGKVTGNPVPPAPMVQEYRNVFQQAIEREKNKTILSNAPRLTEWLRNPDNAALARDDLENLSWFEGFARGAGNTLARSRQRLGQVGNQFMLNQTAGRLQDRSMSFGEILESERGTVQTSEGEAKLLPNLSDIISATGRYIDARYADLIGTDDEANARQYADALQSNIDAMRSIPKSAKATEAENSMFVDGATLGQVLQNVGSTILTNPIGVLSWALETAGESAPQLGAAIGATALTRNPMVGIGVMGAGSFATERYVSVADFLAEEGIDLEKSEDVGRVLSDPAILQEANDRGVIRGLVIAAFDMASAGLAGRTIASNPVVEATAQAVQQAVSGALGEYSARLAAGQEIDWNEIIAEGLAEVATAPVDMGVAGRRLAADRRRAQDAETAVVQAGEISAQSQSSVLRNRMPDKFREFVEAATANGPVANVYVPADQFVEYFQGLGVDPFALVEELDGVTRDDLDVALAGGGDLQIPTATYAAKIAGTEHDAFLMENMRFDPDEFTAREAREFNEKAQDALEEAWEVAEAIRLEQEELRSFEQQIYDDMVSRLRAAGRSTDVATTEALLYPAFYRTMAERSGMTIDEFMARYPLPQVRGDLPEGMQLKDADALTRTLAEARARRTAGLDKRGPTLLEFISDYGGINDPGGELRARDAEVIKRGKGKKTLRLSRGRVAAVRDMFGSGGKKFGVDDVALAAIEAGYLADDPVAIEYQNALREGRQVPDIGRALMAAIDAELRGEPQFMGTAEVDEDADLDKIEAYLASLEVSLDDNDDVIRSALEADQAGRQYGQPAFHGTPHLFEKFSTDHIGTGEGAQAFGWGLYFAGKKEIAEFYRNALTAREGEYLWNGEARYSGDIENDLVAKAQNAGGDSVGYNTAVMIATNITEAVKNGDSLSDMISFVRKSDWDADTKAAWLSALVEANSALTFNRPDGRLFEVEVPDDSELLVWDAPLSEQPESVSAVLDRLLEQRIAAMRAKEKIYTKTVDQIIAGWNGEDAYLELSALLGDDRAASEALRSAGIPGHRYLDGGSRNAQQWSILGPGENTTGKWRVSQFGGANARTFETETEARAFMDEQNRGSYNYVIYDDSRVSVTRFEQSGDVRGARGSIQFPGGGVGNGDTVIRLFQSADLSTMLHESGHYFLTVMRDLAEKGEVGATQDFDAVKAWWRSNADAVVKDAMRVMPDVNVTAEDVIAALDNGTAGEVLKDAAIDVGMQEQFARGFEAYLMEGKAPNIDLRSAFEKFRAWLISIYQRLAGLNVTISDDVREVFDRMIASDEEIAAARETSGDTGALFATAEEMGLTHDEFAAFTKLRAQAEDDAKARLLREAMAPVKRAQEKWFKDERAKVGEEVAREVNALRYYRAIEWMGNRRWFGDSQPADMPDIRLSKQILIDRYGGGILKTLPRGKQTVYAVEGGIDPDDAAGWFGFDSGDEMIRAMEKAPPRKEAIEAETDKLMRERHGDALNDGSIEAAALDAVHTDKRGQWIAAELKAVVEIAGTGVGMTAKEARATARASIARMRVRDAIAANRFLVAERKAGEEAARLGAILAREGVWMQNARRRIATKARAVIRDEGTPNAVAGQIDQANRSTETFNETVTKLIAAKRRQLLNHSLYMEARKVADEVEKAERFVAKLGKKSTREKIAGAGRRENATVDYLSAIDELLERYDFRKMSGAAEQRRGSLVAFVEAMKAAGRENELAIPERVLSDAARKPYKTLPVEELRGVIDSLKNLEHMALRWNKLIDAQAQRELDAVVDDITAAFDANLPKRPPGRVGTKREALRNAGRQFLDLVLNAGTILREIDGFADLGPAYRNIKSPIDEAMNRLIVRKQKAAGDLDALYSVYSKDERRRMAVREHIPQLGYALSKWERIAVALNTGNAGNRQRLTDPKVRGSLTDDQVTAVLATLDERDAKFVQSVWDYIGSFRDDIAARERRATGVEPEWVEAMPVEIAGVSLKGGYYPIKYDPRLSSLARDDETQEIAQSLQAGRFGKAQTRNGHLKDRAQSSGRDVELDLSVMHRHINQVIYDLELSEAVANSWRILQNSRVRGAFIEAGKQADFDALETWLKDVAEGELRSADLVGRSARVLKSNFTAAKLAFNLSTVAIQITGLSQSMVVVGKKDFARGVKATFRRGVIGDITAKSPFMASRETTFNKDIFDFYNDPKTGPVASRWGEIKSGIIGPLSFWLMTKVQWHLVDVPTWLAGYKQGLRKFGNDETKAVAHADAIVKRAQASGLFSDRSAVERGSVSRTARQNDVVRLFTALGSYMFAKFNVAYERSARASRVIGQEGVSLRSAQEALSWTLDMGFLFTLEAVLYAAIKGRLPDDDDDDDESWMAWLAEETAFSVIATVPGFRDVASVAQGFEGGGAYGAITKDLAEPFKQIGQGETDAALVKSIINATGLATGIPSTQINRAVDAAWRQAEGKEVSPLEYLLGRMGN